MTNNVEHTYLVTVLMPAYNAEKHIREAIESILQQTFTDFEFLIIDDGSTDDTVDIINEYSDTRIKLISNGDNKGLIYSLNYGLDIAKGKYIARMDADDISLDTRIEKQVDFLENNSETSILGTAFQFLGTEYEIHHPRYNEEIRIKLLDDVPFAHPTVMLRREAIKDLRYNPQYKYIEDYQFWVTGAIQNLKMANLDEVLLQYRQHEGQVTTQKFEEQQTVKDKIKLEYLSHYFGEYLSDKELSSVNKSFDADLPSKMTILDKLSKVNKKYNLFYQEYFDKYINILIYRYVANDRMISLNDIFKTIKSNVSWKFTNVLFKINLKKLAR